MSLKIILTSTPSDSHMWNLVFMDLFLQENGHQVINLGACVPTEMLYQMVQDVHPDLVVLSSVNGHLVQDAIEMMTALPQSLKTATIPFVVGGKLGTSSEEMSFQKAKLIQLGYDQVFVDKEALISFKVYLDQQMKNCFRRQKVYGSKRKSA